MAITRLNAGVTCRLALEIPSKSKLANSIISGIIYWMDIIEDILAKMRANQKGIRFNELCKVCDSFFGEPRQAGSSHRVYKTPWPGNPRVNIQNAKGKAKPYQVRQVLAAIERWEVENG